MYFALFNRAKKTCKFTQCNERETHSDHKRYNKKETRNITIFNLNTVPTNKTTSDYLKRILSNSRKLCKTHPRQMPLSSD